ncbi:carboxypeptidase-like regulatory domain-containing protein [Bacteroidales bacterium OttesenSCG-928-A17]|nr:carboxypeptidase-like regulatory domain-containing protein [Bacteroidales bacterium OttesenSCG-928-A17]
MKKKVFNVLLFLLLFSVAAIAQETLKGVKIVDGKVIGADGKEITGLGGGAVIDGGTDADAQIKIIGKEGKAPVAGKVDEATLRKLFGADGKIVVNGKAVGEFGEGSAKSGKGLPIVVTGADGKTREIGVIYGNEAAVSDSTAIQKTEQAPGTFKGQVLSKGDNSPMANVSLKITASHSSQETIKTLQTDKNGEFETELPASIYVFSISASGYKSIKRIGPLKAEQVFDFGKIYLEKDTGEAPKSDKNK